MNRRHLKTDGKRIREISMVYGILWFKPSVAVKQKTDVKTVMAGYGAVLQTFLLFNSVTVRDLRLFLFHKCKLDLIK